MKMCRQGSNNLSFSINLFYQSEETHFNNYRVIYLQNRIYRLNVNRQRSDLIIKVISTNSIF